MAIAFIGLACGLVTYSARSFFAPNPWTTLGYVAVLGVATWLIWHQLRGADEMTAAVIVSGAVVIQIGIMAAAAIRSARSPQGIAMLLSGACSLAVAAGISALKVRRQRRLSRV